MKLNHQPFLLIIFIRGELFQAHFLRNFCRDGIFVKIEVHRFGFKVGFAHIEEPVIQLVGIPAVLHLEIFVTFLVNSLAHNHHTMVIGGFFVVEHFLAIFLRYNHFFHRTFNVPLFGFAVFGAQLCPSIHIGSLQIGHFSVHGQHGIALSPFEARFAHIGTSSNGVAIINGIVGNFQQFIDWHILILRPCPVVGHFKGKWLIEWMVGERGN